MAKANPAPKNVKTSAEPRLAVNAKSELDKAMDQPHAGHDDEGLDVVASDAPAPRSRVSDRSAAGQKRFYEGKAEIDHDLFQLEPANMLKNSSYTEIPSYHPVAHSHFFHTVDSNGKKQDACAPVGGHFHMITVTGEQDGVPTLGVSVPMKWVMKRVKGRKVRVAVPLTDDEPGDEDFPGGDRHTHKVVYLKSQKIKLREANANFAAYEAEVHAKQNPSVSGVIAG